MTIGPIMGVLNKWHYLNKWHCVLNKWHLLLGPPVDTWRRKKDMIIGPIKDSGLNKWHCHGLIMEYGLNKWHLLLDKWHHIGGSDCWSEQWTITQIRAVPLRTF